MSLASSTVWTVKSSPLRTGRFILNFCFVIFLSFVKDMHDEFTGADVKSDKPGPLFCSLGCDSLDFQTQTSSG